MAVVTSRELIRKTPGVCGGDACIGDRRIAVWMLVSARRQGIADSALLEQFDPLLTLDDLHAAWEYYVLHPREIDAAIDRNENI